MIFFLNFSCFVKIINDSIPWNKNKSIPKIIFAPSSLDFFKNVSSGKNCNQTGCKIDD